MNVAAAENSSGGSRSGGIIAASSSSSGSSRSVANCAAVSAHVAGACGGDQAAATVAA